MAAAGGVLLYSGSAEARRSGSRTAGPGHGPAAGGVKRLIPALAPLRARRPVPSRKLAAATAAAAVVGAILAYVLFGGVVAVVMGAGFAATFPVAGWHRRVRARADSEAEAWPRLIEEIRMRSGSLGRSIPQALFEAGRRAPAGWQPAFAAAEREWLLTTDFSRTTAMLKDGLASPAADAVLETLLMAHEVGGVDLDAWLQELAEDRTVDLQSRRDAASKQAGVRFARSFVLIVPLGMTLAGLGIGDGRSAYASPGGQAAVAVGILATVGCWIWSGRLMVLPQPPRVFGPAPADGDGKAAVQASGLVGRFGLRRAGGGRGL